MDNRQTNHAWLSDHIHMAWRGPDVIVLDVLHDAYSCLVGAAEHIRISDAGNAVLAHADILDDLLLADLITRRPPAVRRSSCPPPTKTLPLHQTTTVSRTLGVGLNAVSGGLAFRGRTFAELAVPLPPAQGSQPCPQTFERLQHQVSAFCMLLPWLPFQGQCLHRAFMLRRLLAHRGLSVAWVFGVRTWPFMAHCWLQAGDTLVADDLDRVLGFTPILVV